MMYKPVTAMALPEYHLWKKIEKKRTLLSFDLEITARCNNRCRHCYINLPPEDPIAKNNELKLELHPKKISIKTLSSGIDFLGVINFFDYKILRTKTKKRMFNYLR